MLAFALPLLILVNKSISSSALNENERLEEYRIRNYTWPVPDEHFVPPTPGWIALHRRRYEQLERVENTRDRYNGWVHTMSSSVVVPNFTENGWGLTRAPMGIVEELKKRLHDGLPTAETETKIEVIGGVGDSRPLFVDIEDITDKVLNELKPFHEEWSGIPLVGAKAYGLRAYRNQSNLLMHVDRPLTHIVSCILHIDHSEDSDPWPIVIEDFHGNTNEVVLESGDMLFYESSKAFHGRPQNFTGSWYSSIFVHYYPVGWDTKTRDLESHYAVPAHWTKYTPYTERDGIDLIDVVGTSLKEPNCKDIWCGLQTSIKWRGPAVEGVVATTGYDPNDTSSWKDRYHAEVAAASQGEEL